MANATASGRESAQISERPARQPASSALDRNMQRLNPAPNRMMAWVLDRIGNAPPDGLPFPDAPFDVLGAALAHHRVATSLNLTGLGPDDFPNGLFDALTTMRRQRSRRLLAVAAQLREALQALETNGAPALVLKGLANGALFHAEPLRRDSSDIDLLVPDQAFETACATLESLGYRKKETLGPKGKDVVLLRPDAPAAIELHRRLSSEQALFPLDLRHSFERPNIVRMQGLDIPTLSREAAFVYAAAHGMRHFWARLFWLTDIDAATHRLDIDWQAVLDLSRRLGTERQTSVAIELASALLRAPCPAPFDRPELRARAKNIADQLIPYMTGAHPLRDREIMYKMGLLRAIRLELAVQPGLLRKARQIALYLTPTDHDAMDDGAASPFMRRIHRIATAYLRSARRG